MKSPSAHLVSCALPIFARKGFDGASTRELAQAAGRPMSAITYHFGGKEGLYLACAEHIRDTLGGFMITAIEAQQDAAVLTPEQAGEQLSQLLSVLTHAMLGDTADIARFMLREQQEPTAAFDIIWEGIMSRMLGRMSRLLKVIAGDRLSEAETQVRAVSLIGQVWVFRAAHAALFRLTGWDGIGDEQSRMIDQAVQDNLRGILDRLG